MARIAVNTSQAEGGDPQVKGSYLNALREFGCETVIIGPDDDPDKLDGVTGLVLIGGPDIPPEFYGGRCHDRIQQQNPSKVDRDFALIHKAIERGIPILGICAGMQLLGAYFQGTLLPHIPEAGPFYNHQNKRTFHGLVKISGRLKKILDIEYPLVNSRHHQCLQSPGLLNVEALSPDGFIEAVSHPHLPIMGVQWHPEDLTHWCEHYNLFQAFINGYRI